MERLTAAAPGSGEVARDAQGGVSLEGVAPRRRGESQVKRLLTAAVGVPLVLAAIFLLPPAWFFAVCAVIFGWAAVEYLAIARAWAPGAPLKVVPPLALALAALLSLPAAVAGPLAPRLLLAAAGALPLVAGAALLFGRTPVAQAPAALGALAFGVPYFALPIASLCQLQRLDPWLVFLLLALVWLGDTAAFYVGSSWGRSRMAPVVSPKKTWEGAAAGFAVGVAAVVVWSLWRLGEVDWGVLAVGALTACAAQVGDLVESLLKRSAGVKDSGRVLPGHGGVLDRADALLFAAPVLWLGLMALGRG
jgi:phosphatidate cytidylyltransferase